jgi:8-oxoguanine DNA glycosylase-like protein
MLRRPSGGPALTTEQHGGGALQPPIPFSAAKWQHSLGRWWPVDAPGNDEISRSDLFRVASQWRAGNRPVSDLFVLIMAWGYGNVGYGRYRTRLMLYTDGVNEKLEQALESLRSPDVATLGELRSAYRSLSWGGACRLRGLGPAFFTKLLHFAGYRANQAGVQPLILDARVARALPSAGGPSLASWGWTPDEWLTYLTWASEQAAARNVSPDLIELELFRSGYRPRSRPASQRRPQQ